MSEVLEKLDEMPADWKSVAIEEVADVNPRVNKSEISDDLIISFVPMPAVQANNGVINVSQLRPFSEVKKGFTPFLEGDVLFAKITPCMENGKMAIVPKVTNGYGFGSTEFHVLRANERLDARYLYYFVSSKSFRGEAQHNMSGAVGQKRVPTNYLKQHLIPLAPPEQQKRIVAKIEELFSHIDAGIEALNKAKQRLKQYRQSVLKAAVTGKLTKEWREENKDEIKPASALLKEIEIERNSWIEEQVEKGNKEASRLITKLKKHTYENLDDSIVPDGWASVSLTMLCRLVVDCHNKTAPYVDAGIPLIRTSNIKEGEINFKVKMKYVNQDTYEFWSKRCPPEPGDILLTREAPMGESAIVPEAPKVCMGQRMMLLRVIHDLTHVKYLHIALMEPLFQKRIHGFKVGMGVQHLRVGDVEKAVIALPSVTEQKEIVRVTNEKLGAISRLEKDIDSQLVKAEKNKQSILSSAFSGNLKGIISED